MVFETLNIFGPSSELAPESSGPVPELQKENNGSRMRVGPELGPAQRNINEKVPGHVPELSRTLLGGVV